MAGFIDVTNWSANDIKRLGQRDDDNFSITSRRSYRKPVNRTPKPVINYNADDVWAAAVQAYDFNNGYVKAILTGLPGKTNRQLVEQYLSDPIQIKQESRDKAVTVRQYFKGLTFKILQGKQLSDFNNTAMVIANRDVITGNYDIAVIASLPATYEKSVKRDDVERRINFSTGGNLGAIGDKVTATVEVVKQFYSVKWNTNYVTGITDDEKVLFFAYNKEINIGDRVTIEGTVKAHRDNSTQLNRVKVIK